MTSRALVLLAIIGASIFAGSDAVRGAGGMLLTIRIGFDNPNPRKPTGQVHTISDLTSALAQCFKFPPVDEGREAVDPIFELSFKRSGELFGKPRVIKFSRQVSDAERGRFYAAVAEAIDRCAQMPFTDSMGGAVAGTVFRIRLIDERKRKQADISWLTKTG